jgi:D-alanyl-D-alanine carboxypeptidase
MPNSHRRTAPHAKPMWVAVIAAVFVALAACGSPSSPSSRAEVGSTAAANAAAGPASTCVSDVDKVVSTPATVASSTKALPADLVARLDAAARASFEDAATPGVIVGVRTPQGTWTEAYGVADPATQAPMRVGMHTRIGSVTKTVTGTVIMQLAQQGKLSLDDVIDAYVPGVPNGDRITLRLLANMSSGVASYSRSPKFTDVYSLRPETVWNPDELIAIGLAESPVFEPGARFDYSNTNTLLLGKVIEKVTHRPVAAVFHEQVFEPLGLSATSWPGTATALPDPHPQGFTLQGDAASPDHPSNATNWNPSWGWTAGELISDMDDLLTYGRALGTGQGLLDAATQAERLGSFPGPAGYGIAMGCANGWVGHTGELPGYNTSVFYDTTSDTTVIVQANSDIASGSCPDSPTLTDDPHQSVCSSPATRVFVGLSIALGHPFTPPPQT